ncbi:hypothetical protein [Oryzifoliimicrobium ureilyticus]|uniref:hypothetical protein n=1 Tax=Oryzifoliimicrobium ureilyticus TaxID=3113724 RepID=UPI0030763D70
MNSIVIARYKEDLAWVLKIPSDFEIFIYNKGDAIVDPRILEKADHVIDRPNAGRESETYLHHMLTHRRTDRDFTVFCQGDPFEHSPDFLELLASWNLWPDLQPLTWQWRGEANVPPAVVLEDYERHLGGRLRVRAERFSLSTWGPLDFIDTGALRTSIDYRAFHGNLPEGTNIAAHFLRMAGLNDLAAQASVHAMGIFCYGAMFAVRNHLVAQLPSESIAIMIQASKGLPVYGYVLERMWLHFFGASFELLRVPLASHGADQRSQSPAAGDAQRGLSSGRVLAAGAV